MAVPVKLGFSQLVGDYSYAIPLPDVVIAVVVKMSDTTDPTQHLCLHDTEVTLGFSCRWPAFSSIECDRPGDCPVDLRLEMIADLLVTKDTGHHAQLCPAVFTHTVVS